MAGPRRHKCHEPKTIRRRLRTYPEYTIKLRLAPRIRSHFPNPLPTGIKTKASKRPAASRKKTVSSTRSEVGKEPFSTFMCFPELPMEIRLMIWEYARPGPRLVELKRHTWYRPTISKKRSMTLPTSLVSSAVIPAMLHVNSESRTQAMKWYQLSFQDRSEATYMYQDAMCPKVWFDSSVDTLYLGPSCGLIVYPNDLKTALTRNDLALVQHVAVAALRTRFETLELFPNLKSIEIVDKSIVDCEPVSAYPPLSYSGVARTFRVYKEKNPNSHLTKLELKFTEYRTVEDDYDTSDNPRGEYCAKCAFKPEHIFDDPQLNSST